MKPRRPLILPQLGRRLLPSATPSTTASTLALPAPRSPLRRPSGGFAAAPLPFPEPLVPRNRPIAPLSSGRRDLPSPLPLLPRTCRNRAAARPSSTCLPSAPPRASRLPLPLPLPFLTPRGVGCDHGPRTVAERATGRAGTGWAAASPWPPPEGRRRQQEAGEGDALDEDEVGDADAEVAPVDLDPARYENDEAYARALQEAEEREVAGRLMALAGIGDWRPMEEDDEEEEDGDPQDTWEDVDEQEEYSYEELIALGEVVGTESKGLPADAIDSLPSVTYQAQEKQDGNMEQCVICRVEFQEGESLVALPCKHSYHSECINRWLRVNKVCPMCSSEVSTSVNK